MRPLPLITIAFLVLLASTANAMQTAFFKIRADITDQQITLIPVKGCAWKPTTFSKTKGEWSPLIVTATEAYEPRDRNTQPKGSFSFVLIPENRGAKLIAICGVTWRSTSFADSRHPHKPVSWFIEPTGVCAAE